MQEILDKRIFVNEIRQQQQQTNTSMCSW